MPSLGLLRGEGLVEKAPAGLHREAERAAAWQQMGTAFTSGS